MSRAEHADLKVDGDRLWDCMDELASIGGYEDPASGLAGVNRQTMTPADVKARDLLITWLEGAGLAVRVDGIGNIYGRRPGTDPDAPVVMMGSHIDSVPTAGAFDGPLGVLGALEVVRTLNDCGRRTRRTLEVACFTEEEGVRFGTDMLGSAVASGRIRLEDALALRDADGSKLGEELQRTGYAGPADHLLRAPFAYLECHVEQGPLLSHTARDIGVVTGTQGISWQEVTILGKAAHAGATPPEFRVDAGVGAASLITQLQQMVLSGDFGQLRATVGRLRLSPGAVNIVPAAAELTIDLRHPDDESMALAERELQRLLRALESQQPGLRVQTRRLAKTGRVQFDDGMQSTIGLVADDLGLTHAPVLSGAGHDAQEMARLCPAGMIFVPGEYDGISHSPREYSTPEACAAGIAVLANAAVRLADRD